MAAKVSNGSAQAGYVPFTDKLGDKIKGFNWTRCAMVAMALSGVALLVIGALTVTNDFPADIANIVTIITGSVLGLLGILALACNLCVACILCNVAAVLIFIGVQALGGHFYSMIPAVCTITVGSLFFLAGTCLTCDDMRQKKLHKE